MQRPLLIVLILVVAAMSSCQSDRSPVSLCTTDLLTLFLKTRQANVSEMALELKYGSMLVENQQWSINQRDDRCDLILMADVNGETVVVTRWYVDPLAAKVYPNDSTTTELVGLFGLKNDLIASPTEAPSGVDQNVCFRPS